MKLPTVSVLKRHSEGMVVENNKRGFILLFAVLSIGFLLAITINLADSIYKQHTFLSFSSESLNALNNSNAGIECALYWDRQFNSFKTSETSHITCGGQDFIVGGNPISSFILLSDDGKQSTDVKVDKSEIGTTTITATGYSTTDITSEKRVSRPLVAAYRDMEGSEICAGFDIVFDLDISQTIEPPEQAYLENAANLLVDNLGTAPDSTHVGIVSFYGQFPLNIGLSSDVTLLHDTVNAINNGWPYAYGTNLSGSLLRSLLELNNNGRPAKKDAIILITDGQANKCTNPDATFLECPGSNYDQKAAVAETQAADYADQARDEDKLVVVYGVGLNSNPAFGTYSGLASGPNDYMRNIIASKPDLFFPIDSYANLEEAVSTLDCNFLEKKAGKVNTKEQ